MIRQHVIPMTCMYNYYYYCESSDTQIFGVILYSFPQKMTFYYSSHFILMVCFFLYVYIVAVVLCVNVYGRILLQLLECKSLITD